MQLANQRQQGNTNLECLMSIGTPPYFCKTQRGFIAELHSSHTCRPFRVLLGFATKIRKQNKMQPDTKFSVNFGIQQPVCRPAECFRHTQTKQSASKGFVTNEQHAEFISVAWPTTHHGRLRYGEDNIQGDGGI
jgi:hypothetical protein